MHFPSWTHMIPLTYCPRSDLLLPESCPYVSAIRDYLKEEACKKRHRGESKEDDFDLTHKYLDRAWCIETLVGKKHYSKDIKPVLLAKVWHKNDIPVHTLFALLRPKRCKPRWLKKHWQKMSDLEAKC